MNANPITLTKQDQHILEAVFEGWDLALPGDVSYANVITLCHKLGIPVPQHMVEMLADLDTNSNSQPKP